MSDNVILIWLIGYAFTCGISMPSKDSFLVSLARCLFLSVFWPVMLGVMVKVYLKLEGDDE